MIYEGKYKDRPAVIVETSKLRATFLYLDGAKMASLISLSDGKELLAVKEGETYKRLSYDGSYVDSECSAFDDMFPTIDPYTPNDGIYKGITYPDHGETCRLEYEFALSRDAVTFTAESRVFDMSYQKTVSVTDDGGIVLGYRADNRSDESFPYVFASHIMLKGEDGMVLDTPFSSEAPCSMVFATEGYDVDELPRDRFMGFRPGIGAAYKFYYTEKMSEGRFSLRYPDSRKLTFEFDKEKMPYLGVWINNGEFQGIYNIAPEPCTVPFDAPHKAAERGYFSDIAPRSSFELDIKISIG